jgi:hypothetical protein
MVDLFRSRPDRYRADAEVMADATAAPRQSPFMYAIEPGTDTPAISQVTRNGDIVRRVINAGHAAVIGAFPDLALEYDGAVSV